MKTRLASSLFVAAAATFALAGCGMIAPQATLDPYAPSDGVEASVAEVEVRNLMLITDSESREFNVVFTGVNGGESAASLGFDFVNDDGRSLGQAQFRVQPGLTSFGLPDGEMETVSLSRVDAGATVTTFIQTPGGDAEVEVPVIDGTATDVDGTASFPEYRALVP